MNSTKEQGIQKVIDNNPEDYAKIKRFAFEWLRRRFKTFTSDDLRADYESENEPPLNPSVYGGVFSVLARQKLILHRGRFKKTKRKLAHARDLKIWKSLCVSENHYEQSA